MKRLIALPILLVVGIIMLASTASARPHAYDVARAVVAIPDDSDAYVSVRPTTFANELCGTVEPEYVDSAGVVFCPIDPLDGDGFHIEDSLRLTPEFDVMVRYDGTSELTFDQLPTLPNGATITAATLLLKGDLYGFELEAQVFDTFDNHVATGHASGIVTVGDKNNYDCYNYYHGGENCTAVPFTDVEMEIGLPVSMIEGWYGGDAAVLTFEPNACDDVLFVTTPVDADSGCSFSGREVMLYIEYDAPFIGINGERFSVVPSESGGVFGRTEHRYTLSDPLGSEDWYGVVAMPVDDMNQPVLSRQVPLNMRTNYEIGGYNVFGDNNVQGGNGFNYIAISNTGLPDGLTETVVVGRDSDAPDDSDYRIEYVRGRALANPSPISNPQTIATFESYADIFTFEVEPSTNLYVKVSAPNALAMGDIRLFPQSTGRTPENRFAAAVAGDGYPAEGPYGSNGRLEYVVKAEVRTIQTEVWGLAVPHGILGCISNDGAVQCIDIDIDLIACPSGYYYAERFEACQPLFYPHPTLFREAPLPSIPATSVQTVGDVRIFSEGGFDFTPTVEEYGSSSYDFCTDNEQLGMPLIGTPSDSVPISMQQAPSETLIPVAQGSVCVTGTAIEIIGGPEGFGAIMGPSYREMSARSAYFYNDTVNLYHGRYLEAFGNWNEGRMNIVNGEVLPHSAGDRNIEPYGWNNGGQVGEAGHAAWPSISNNSVIDIASRSVTSSDSGTVSISSAPNSYDVPFSTTWTVAADYDQRRFEFSAETPTIPDHMEVASMVLRSHDHFLAEPASHVVHQPSDVRVIELRLADATIHQSAEMGGAYKPIRSIVQPVDTDRCDGESCITLTNANSFTNEQWDMPDIDISQEAGTVMMRSAGHLQVYSNDHPDSAQLRQLAPDFSADFNFEAFDAEVSVSREACPASEGPTDPTEVVVIRGEAEIAIPTMGDGANGGEQVGGEGPSLKAEFLLCQTQLRTVALEFNAHPPGIPVGSSGLILTSLSGRVDIVPQDYAVITLGVTFSTADGAILSDISGEITIDTRGQFSFSGGATVVGTLDASGSLTVGWNPLDILLRVEIGYQEWFEGFAQIHLWRGQGWGDPAPYPWLPDNNDMHFTGMVGAQFHIDQGEIGQFFGIELPRQNITISVDVSFGQFCENEDCTELVWGVQGKLQVMEFTIGVFVGSRGSELIGSGVQVDFFIGDGDRQLIDQFGGSRAAFVPNAPVSLLGRNLLYDGGSVDGACPTIASGVTCTFNIAPDMGEAMFTAAWSETTLPDVDLLTPAGQSVMALVNTDLITPGSVQSVDVDADTTVSFTLDQTGVLFTVSAPDAGDWQLTLDGVTGNENYSVMYALNSLPPTLELTTGNGSTPLTSPTQITWQADNADTSSQVHLFYVAEDEYQANVQGGTVITPTAAIPFAINLEPVPGSYDWTPTALASDTYRVMARIDHPIYGSTFAYSPGTFVYDDTTPPAVPASVHIRTQDQNDDGLIISWNRNGEADLSQYEVVYSSPSLDTPSGYRERILNVAPSDPLLTHPTREQVHLIAQLEGVEATACVRAIDASGNVSACSAEVSIIPGSNSATLLTTPVMDSVSVGTGKTLAATWLPAFGDGYLLSWANGCAGSYAGTPALEGNPNLDVGDVTSFELSELPAGTYRVAVRSYNLLGGLRHTIGSISGFSEPMTIVLTDGVDDNGDGIPDDWAARYGILNASADFDNDRLSNLDEYLQGTIPTVFDSDDDGFGDGEEIAVAGTDPCDVNDRPNVNEALYMSVKPDNPYEGTHFAPPGVELERPGQLSTYLNYDFMTTEDTNFLSEVKRLNIKALGNGSLTWQASASQPWVVFSPNSGGPLTGSGDHNTLGIRVLGAGLAPGFHTAIVTIEGTSANPLYGAVQQIPLSVWVQRRSPTPESIVNGIVSLAPPSRSASAVEGVDVCLVTTQGLVAECTETDENGRYEFSQVPYRRFNFRVIHDGYVQTNEVLVDVGAGEVSADITVTTSTVPTAVTTRSIHTMAGASLWALLAVGLLTAATASWLRRD